MYRASFMDKCRVMLVDDHVAIRVALRRLLAHYHGLRIVGEASDGHQAIELMERCRAHVILMDINMPKMDGRRAIQIIKEDKEISRIPLVVFTTSSSTLDKRYFELYQVEYITKPNQYQAFTNKVYEMLSHVTAG